MIEDGRDEIPWLPGEGGFACAKVPRFGSGCHTDGPLSRGQECQKPLGYVASLGASASMRGARKLVLVSAATLPRELQESLRKKVGGTLVEQLPLLRKAKPHM